MPGSTTLHRLFVAVLQLLASVVLGVFVVLPLVLFDGYGQYWWLDELAHFTAGVSLALVVHLIVSRLTDSSTTVVVVATGTVVVLQVGWEVVEWWVGLRAVVPTQTGVGAVTMTGQAVRAAVGELYPSVLAGVQTASDVARTATGSWPGQPARVIDAARRGAVLLSQWVQHPKADDTLLDTVLAVNGAYIATKATELLSGERGDGTTPGASRPPRSIW